jgi:hypothetical protein
MAEHDDHQLPLLLAVDPWQAEAWGQQGWQPQQQWWQEGWLQDSSKDSPKKWLGDSPKKWLGDEPAYVVLPTEAEAPMPRRAEVSPRGMKCMLHSHVQSLQ